MTNEEIQRKLAEYREIGRTRFDRLLYPKFVQLIDRGTMGTVLCCPSCGERMASIPHWELVSEHFGCAGCGKVFFECDGHLWLCKHPEQDVPHWRLKHKLPPEAKIVSEPVQKTSRKDFRTRQDSGDSR